MGFCHKLVIENAMVQTWGMCSVLELERDKDRMATDGPEARAFRMALEVLQDRNNRIGGKWNIRVPCLPPIFENLIAVHVMHLLGTFCLGEGISHRHTRGTYPSMQKARSEGGHKSVVALVHKSLRRPWCYHHEWIRCILLLLSCGYSRGA
jgi:hypothetical protein